MTRDEKLIDYLRRIRDTAWQMNRQHHTFAAIESVAVEALRTEFGIDDGQANPRPYGWWETKRV